MRGQRVVDYSEDPPPDGALVFVADGAIEIANQLGQFGARCADLGLEGRQGFVSVRDDPVAPSFGISEDTLLPPVVGTKAVEQGADRFGIDVAHELADELSLTALSFAGSHPAQIGNRFAEALVEIETIEQFVRQLRELLAECL